MLVIVKQHLVQIGRIDGPELVKSMDLFTMNTHRDSAAQGGRRAGEARGNPRGRPRQTAPHLIYDTQAH